MQHLFKPLVEAALLFSSLRSLHLSSLFLPLDDSSHNVAVRAVHEVSVKPPLGGAAGFWGLVVCRLPGGHLLLQIIQCRAAPACHLQQRNDPISSFWKAMGIVVKFEMLLSTNVSVSNALDKITSCLPM